MNHLILIFKKSLSEIRNRNLSPTIHYFKYKVKNIMKIEYKIAQYNNKLDFHFKKWDVLTDKLNKLKEYIFCQFLSIANMLLDGLSKFLRLITSLTTADSSCA